MTHRNLSILGFLFLMACVEVGNDGRIHPGGDDSSGLYAGAAAIEITPVLRETYVDLDYALDASGAAGHRGYNGQFDGDLKNPAGRAEAGVEPFHDANGNGVFEPVWMANSTARPANAVHDPLWTRALLVRSGKTTVAFVTLDAFGYFNNEVRAIQAEVQKQVVLDQVILAASHSHETPDTLGIYGPTEGVPGYDEAYMTSLREKTVAAIVEAAKRAVKVEMVAAQGGIISPKTPQLKVGNMLYDGRDPVVIDDTLAVLQFRIPGGKVVATFVNWAGHPEHMIEDDTLSSDYPHYVRSRLEAEYSGSVAMFANGVLGGQIGTNHADVIRGDQRFKGKAGIKCRRETHPYQIERMKKWGECPPGFTIGDNTWMWKKAEAVGLHVAERAIELLSGAKPVAKAPLQIRSKEVYLPVENKGFRLMLKLRSLYPRQLFQDAEGKRPGDPAAYKISDVWYVRTDVHRIDLGPVQMLTIPGELHPELAVGYATALTGGIQPQVSPNNPNPPDLTKAPPGPYLRERMSGEVKFLLGLTQDELGYIIPRWNFELDAVSPYLEEAKGDHYEETMSLGPETADLLLRAYDELLR